MQVYGLTAPPGMTGFGRPIRDPAARLVHLVQVVRIDLDPDRVRCLTRAAHGRRRP